MIRILIPFIILVQHYVTLNILYTRVTVPSITLKYHKGLSIDLHVNGFKKLTKIFILILRHIVNHICFY